MRANITYCFPYLCCNVYMCCCFQLPTVPPVPPTGVRSSCVPFLGHAAMLSVPRWQHLRCCGEAGCCTLTTFEIKPQAWHGRLPRACAPPVLYRASLILSHRGYYNKCGCVAGINSISPSSSGTPHHHWQHKLKLWLYQTEASQEVRLGEIISGIHHD